jgi:hypothetical protein
MLMLLLNEANSLTEIISIIDLLRAAISLLRLLIRGNSLKLAYIKSLW